MVPEKRRNVFEVKSNFKTAAINTAVGVLNYDTTFKKTADAH